MSTAPAATGIEPGSMRSADELAVARYESARLRRLLASMGLRARSLVAGLVLAVLLTTTTAIVRLMTEPATVSDGVKVVDATGELVLVADGLVHPVRNRTSALLLGGELETVSPAELAGLATGPVIGIAGAPGHLPATDTLASSWSVCATSSGVRLELGFPDLLPPDPRVAVLAEADDALWLLSAAGRSPVEPGAALGLDLDPQRALAVPGPLIQDLPEVDPPAGLIATTASTICIGSDPTALVRVPTAGSTAGSGVEVMLSSAEIAPLTVLMRPGGGALLRVGAGRVFLLTEAGERFEVADPQSLRLLGYESAPVLEAPDWLLSHLAPALVLSASAVAIDGGT